MLALTLIEQQPRSFVSDVLQREAAISTEDEHLHTSWVVVVIVLRMSILRAAVFLGTGHSSDDRSSTHANAEQLRRKLASDEDLGSLETKKGFIRIDRVYIGLYDVPRLWKVLAGLYEGRIMCRVRISSLVRRWPRVKTFQYVPNKSRISSRRRRGSCT